MQRVSYERVLNRDWDCILIGKGLNRLKSSKDVKASFIRTQTPMSFTRINNYIMEILGELDYINFWSEVKIYRISNLMYTK